MKQILTAVRGEKGKVFLPGMEADLAKAVDQSTLERLKAEGVIDGDWLSFQDADNFLPFEETMERFQAGDDSSIVFDSLKYWQKQKVADKAKAEAEETGAETGKPEKGEIPPADGLPKDFPAAHVFEKLGFKTVAEIQSLTKDELVGLDGIGDVTAEKALAYGKQ